MFCISRVCYDFDSIQTKMQAMYDESAFHKMNCSNQTWLCFKINVFMLVVIAVS